MFRWVLLLIVGSGPCRAHEPITTNLTWTREISRIVYKRCVSCHREGGKAMSLVSYDEARPWAKAIKEEVLERRMPPWGAVKGFGEFQNDASLSETEIEIIAAWVEGGAPKGEDIYQPALPPPAPPNAAAPAANRVPLQGAVVLDRDVVALGIEPSSPGQIVAERPDGSIEPLIWMLHMRPEQPRAFYFRESIPLPKGTTVRAAGYLLITAKPATSGSEGVKRIGKRTTPIGAPP